jgi:hypothetical protein
MDTASIRELAATALSAGVTAGLSPPRAREVLCALWPASIELPALDEVEPDASACAPASLGARYESLFSRSRPGAKKRQGSFYTPVALARRLCERASSGRALRSILDPSCGAGAVLLEALAFALREAIYGTDLDPLAVWLARVALALASGAHQDRDLAGWNERVRVCDALSLDAFAPGRRFDAIVGNPPWVAYAGRATEPIDPRTRADYRVRFRSFAGFPTAHGMFIERAGQLLSEGARMALLVPVSVADLDGYRATRAALARSARVDEPLEELGFDQFDGVVQPTMILVATALDGLVLSPVDPASEGAPWALSVAAGAPARPALAPSLVERLRALPRFAPETFGEGGFQSAGEIAENHIGSWPAEPRFSVPLREGADVEPFACRPPSIALDPDPAALARAKVSLRPDGFYQRVSVILRQTARYPIAARHDPPFAFRNSLLAGFHEDPDALCALLNSALLRAAHLSSQRDGRQAVFPQLKVAHLRALPAPPEGASLATLSVLAKEAAAAQRARLDAVALYVASEKTQGRKVPRRAFELEGGALVGSENYRKKQRDPEARAAYERALAEASAAWERARRAIDAIDDEVFALYGVREDERESVRAALT